MTRLLIDVKLEVLIVDEEAATLLENGEMSIVLLSEHVQVITLC
jgi:hypothetical protein